jgi:GH24 family phage-related lysozyme (muramidase)
MLRRTFLSTLPLAAGFVAGPAFCVTQKQRQEALFEFDRKLAAATATNQFEKGRQWRELQYWDASTIPEAQGHMTGTGSKRKIEQHGVDLIIAAEVSGRAVYKKKYTHPVVPGGESGVTIGIGYDLSAVNKGQLKSHWDALLTPEQCKVLGVACKASGSAARKLLKQLKQVTIEWDAARQQFDRFLPYVIAATERAFPKTDKISNVSMGALVSLVYNRGNQVIDTPRRVHMYRIAQAMEDERFSDIPKHFRDMKVIWANKPDMAGVLVRRDLEADLFEAGLS